MQSSFSIFFEFSFLDFCLDLIEFFKCMIWQSNPLFFVFVHTTFLLRAITHAIVGFPDWSITLHVRIVLKKKGCLLVKRVVHTISVSKKGLWLKGLFNTISVNKQGLWLKGLFIPFLLARKSYGSKGCPQDMGIFLVNMSQSIDQGWFRDIMVLGLVFLVIKKELAGLKLACCLGNIIR